MSRLSLLALVLIVLPARADNWPAWRGPTGQGHSAEKNLPLTWSATTNVRWKIPLADPGNSTPAVWGDRIFVTQANKEGTTRSLICFARADGKKLWQADVSYPDKETKWGPPSWYANASPATDGERVVVCFGSAGVYCYDFAGKELWKRTDLGKWEHKFGNGRPRSCTVTWRSSGAGRMRMRTRNRPELPPGDGQEDRLDRLGARREGGSWARRSLPGGGRGPDVARGGPAPERLRPEDRQELWACSGLQSTSPSALSGNGVAVGMSGYGRSSLAVELGGRGTSRRTGCGSTEAGQPAGRVRVIVGDHLYLVDENAIPHCYELTTGKDAWEGADRLKGAPTWGSIVHADGRLYLLMRTGETVVMAAKPKFEVLTVNPLERGEQTNSSIAVSDGELFIRTFKHLHCIREAMK